MIALPIIVSLVAGCFAQSSRIAITTSSSSPSSASSSANSKYKLYDGPCRQITTKPVNFVKHSGLWYEIARSDNTEDGSETCHKVLWRLPVNNTSEVIHKSYNPLTSTTQTLSSMAAQGHRGLEFTHHFPTLGDIVTEFFPLDFDSSQYAIAWVCENRGNKHVEKMNVFARNPVPMANLKTLVREAFNKYNLPVPEISIHDHSKFGRIWRQVPFKSVVNGAPDYRLCLL